LSEDRLRQAANLNSHRFRACLNATHPARLEKSHTKHGAPGLLTVAEEFPLDLVGKDARPPQHDGWLTPPPLICPICGNPPTIKELIDSEAYCGISGERDRAISRDSPTRARPAPRGVSGPLDGMAPVR
jgi:hypothetical protein